MSLRQLRAFVAIARHGGVSAGARALRVSQPALTLQLRQLETRLGVALLVRHAKGVTLTPAGEVFLTHATAALEAIRQGEDAVASLREALPEALNLGFTPTAGRALGPELLELVARTRPSVALHLREGLTDALWQGMAERELAAAICYAPVPPGLAHCTPLYQEDLWVVGSAEMLRQLGPISPEAVASLPLVLGERSHSARRFIEAAASAWGVTMDAMLEVEPVLLKREMLMRQGRCSIVPYGLFREELRAGRLFGRPIAPPMRRVAVLAVRKDLTGRIEGLLLASIQPLVTRVIADGGFGWLPPPGDAAEPDSAAGSSTGHPPAGRRKLEEAGEAG